jgi:hypothetical protein
VPRRADFQRFCLPGDKAQSPLSYAVRARCAATTRGPSSQKAAYRSLRVTLLRPHSISAFLSAVSPPHEASRYSQIPAKAPLVSNAYPTMPIAFVADPAERRPKWSTTILGLHWFFQFITLGIFQLITILMVWVLIMGVTGEDGDSTGRPAPPTNYLL